MRTTIRPITTRLLARIRQRNLLSDAVEEIIVDRACHRPSPEAICLPGENERIVAFDSVFAPEMAWEERAACRFPDHAATIIRTVEDVILVDGSAYRPGTYMVLAAQHRRPLPIDRYEHFDSGLLCTNNVIDRYFGHWVHDGLPCEVLANDLGLLPLTVAGGHRQHEPGYRNLVDRFDIRIRAARVARLSIADCRGLNDGWARRMDRVRATLRSKLPADGTCTRVFVMRGKHGVARMLTNEAEIANALAARGYDILDPMEEKPETIARALVNSELVVAVEGSAQAHQFLAAAAGTVSVTIMPPRRFNGHWKPFLDAIGIGWAYVLADDRDHNSFYQPIDRLLRTIDLAERAIRPDALNRTRDDP